MVELEEFPGCFGIGECGGEKIDLGLSVIVAGAGIGVAIHRRVLFLC